MNDLYLEIEKYLNELKASTANADLATQFLKDVVNGGPDDEIEHPESPGLMVPSIYKFTKERIEQAIENEWPALNAMVQGRQAYNTKDELPLVPPEGILLAEVWNDPVIENNGLYGFVGTEWVKSPYDMQSYYKVTSKYLEGSHTLTLSSQDHPNLYYDYNHMNPSVMWRQQGNNPERVIVNSRPCLRFGAGVPEWARYTRQYKPSDFPSGFVSASFKIEAFGPAKDENLTDRLMILQYSTDYNSIETELSRTEVEYKKDDITNGYVLLNMDAVPIHPDAKSIYLYVEANTWDIYVSEICIADGKASDYRYPVQVFMDKQLWPSGYLKVDSSDKISNVINYDDSGEQITIDCNKGTAGYLEFITEAIGDLSPGSKVVLSAEMLSNTNSGCDINLFQYDNNGVEIARQDLFYSKSGSEWDSQIVIIDILNNTATVKGRIVNRAIEVNVEDTVISASFKNVYLRSIKQTNTIVDPVGPLRQLHRRINGNNERLKKLETYAVTNYTISNLLKDPYRFSEFGLDVGNKVINENGNWHVFLNPSISNTKSLINCTMPAYFFTTGKISAGVTISRRPEGANGVRVILIQYDSNGTELTRVEKTINTIEPPVSEYDQETWVPVSFVDVELHQNADSIKFFVGSGTGHIWGVYFTKPWIVDGTASAFVPIQNYPNYWIDPELNGTGMSTLPGDQAGTLQKDRWGNYLTMDNVNNGVLVRRYYMPAENIFRPGNSGFLRATIRADSFPEPAVPIPEGAEIGLLFFDKDNTEISRVLFKNSENDKFITGGIPFTVPSATYRVQIRFVLWGSKANKAYFRDVVISDNYNGSINRAFSVFGAVPSGNTDAKVVYISPNGNDSNIGTKNSPKLTLLSAYEACGPNGRIIVLDGEYGKDSFTVPSGANLTIMAEGLARPRFINGDEYIGTWTKTPGRTKIWQMNTILSPFKFIFEHMTPEGLISDEDRHPLHRGRTHRLPSFRLKNSISLDALDTAENGGWYYDADLDILYITTVNGDDPNTHRYFRPSGEMIKGSGSLDSHLNIEGIESWYAPINFTGMASYSARDCRVIGSRSDGCKRDNARGIEYRMEFAAADNDGSNSHNGYDPVTGIPSSDVPGASTVVSFDMYCHDNWDDGDSLHERCEGEYHGGLWECNGDRGVATAYGAHVIVYNGIARDNGINGQSPGLNKTSGEGFSSLGSALPEEGGIGTQMICFNCESYRNNVNFSAYGIGCLLVCNQTISRDARVVGYYAKHGKLIAKNCFESGSALPKDAEDGGEVIIENTPLLS